MNTYTEKALSLKANIETSLTGINTNKENIELLKAENETLKAENALLNEELVNTQLALCDVYEMLVPTTVA